MIMHVLFCSHVMLHCCWTQQGGPCPRRRQTGALASGTLDTLTISKKLLKESVLESFPVLIFLSCLLEMALFRYFPDLNFISLVFDSFKRFFILSAWSRRRHVLARLGSFVVCMATLTEFGVSSWSLFPFQVT